MKCSKVISTLVTVIALVLSVSIMAYAATGPYTYSFINVITDADADEVSIARANHYAGIARTISYEYDDRVYTFDYTQFQSNHRSGLQQAYEAQRWKSVMNVQAYSGNEIIPSDAAPGVYKVMFYYYYREGTWCVNIGDTITYSGPFTNSPMYYDIEVEKA